MAKVATLGNSQAKSIACWVPSPTLPRVSSNYQISLYSRCSSMPVTNNLLVLFELKHPHTDGLQVSFPSTTSLLCFSNMLPLELPISLSEISCSSQSFSLSPSTCPNRFLASFHIASVSAFSMDGPPFPPVGHGLLFSQFCWF